MYHVGPTSLMFLARMRVQQCCSGAARQCGTRPAELSLSCHVTGRLHDGTLDAVLHTICAPRADNNN